MRDRCLRAAVQGCVARTQPRSPVSGGGWRDMGRQVGGRGGEAEEGVLRLPLREAWGSQVGI